MFRTRWLRSSASQARSRTVRPRLEPLEERVVLADEVFVLGDVTSSINRALFRFDRNGTFRSSFASDSRLGSTVATKNSELFVEYDFFRIRRYAPDGTFLGTFVDTTTSSLNAPINTIEFDTAGNLYVAPSGSSSQPRTSVRFNSSGTQTATYSHASLVFPAGIDADSSGNVYIVNSAGVGVGNDLFKFSGSGTFLGSIDLDRDNVETPSDLAIDQTNRRLYISDFAGGSAGVKVYDISATTPTFLRSISNAAFNLPTGISFDSGSGNLFVGSFASASGAIEITSTGTLVRTYATSTLDGAWDVVRVNTGGGGGDTTPPTITTRTPTPGSTVTGSSVNVDVTFSEQVFGVDVTDLVLSGAAASGASRGTPTLLSGNTWRFPISNLGSGALNLSLAPDANDIEDGAGNDLAPAVWSYTVSLADRFEPNNIFATAADLGTLGDRTETNLSIHAANNDDYFRLRAAGSGTLRVDLSFTHALGDVDLSVFDAAFNTLGSSGGTTNSERVTVSVTGGQTYYIKVIGYSGATNPNYTLVVDGPVADTTSPTVTGQTPTTGSSLTSSSVNIDVTFSEPVVGVDVSGLVLTGSAASGASRGTPTLQGGTSWRFPVSGLVSGSLDIALAPDVNDIEDLVGNDLSPRPTRWSYTVTLNRAPTARPGGPYRVLEGEGTQFDGSASSDPEEPASALSYAWDLDGDSNFGETGANAGRGDETGPTPTYSAVGMDGPSSAIVRLRVTDQGSLSDTAQAEVSVDNAPPTATFSNSGPFDAGSPALVTFTEATDPSPADREAGLRYSYDFNNDGDFLDDGEAANIVDTSRAHTFLAPGTYRIHGRVSDRDDGFTDYFTDVVVEAVPVDVTSLVQITRGGFRYNRATGRWLQTLTIANRGQNTLQGPLSLVLDGLTAGVILANRTGMTTRRAPLNSPYIDLISAELAPLASVLVTLEFLVPTGQRILYTLRLLAGPGRR